MRRMWMLLLVVALMVIALAVPAMAAEHEHGTCIVANGPCEICGSGNSAHGDGWTELTAETNLVAGGKYYLTGNISRSITWSSGEITICLNGHTWSGVTGDTNTRPLTVTGGTVTIVDCSTRTNYISGGTIEGVNIYIASDSPAIGNCGGTILVNGGVVTFYNGTITGGSAGRGGNVYINGAGSVFNLYGGKIVGVAKTVTVDKATGNGAGVAYHRGGNVCLYTNATFNMGNAETAKIGNGRVIPAMEGGYASNKQGGSLAVNATSVAYMVSGVISGGVSANTGGNVYINGTNSEFNMSGGLVTGGALGTIGSNALNSTASTSNLYAVGANLTMSGGEITGHAACYNYRTNLACVVTLSGSAKVTGNGLQLNVDVNNNNQVMQIPRITIGDGGFNEDASITLNVANANKFKEFTITNPGTDSAKYNYSISSETTDPVHSFDTRVFVRGTMEENAWFAYENELLASGVLKVAANDTIAQLTFEEDGIYFRPADNADAIWHCVCCGDQSQYLVDGQIVHIGDCDHYDHKWIKYSMSYKGTFPSTTSHGVKAGEATYFFLVDGDGDKTYTLSATSFDGQKTVGGANVIVTAGQTSFCVDGCDIYIDMRGIINYCRWRAISLHGASAVRSGGAQNVTFTDSLGGGGFTIDVDRTGYYANNTNGITTGKTTADNSAIWVAGYNQSTGAKSDLTMYRIKVDAQNSKWKNAPAFKVESGNSLNLFGVEILGGTAGYSKTAGSDYSATSDGLGGAIYATGNSRVKLEGCTISGGHAAVSGGLIYFTGGSGSLDMTDCTLSGGTCGADGGSVYMYSGPATFTRCTFTAGTEDTTAGSEGGIIYSNSKLTMINCTVTGGKAGTGGFLYGTGSSDISITGGSISNGVSTGAGGLMQTGANLKLERVTLSNGQAARNGGSVYVYNGEAEIINCTFVGGETTASSGGALGVRGTATLTNCTITGGKAKVDGGSVHVQGVSGTVTPTLTINGGRISGGVAGSNGGCVNSNSSLTMNGVNVSGGQAGCGGNISVQGGTASISNCQVTNGVVVRAKSEDGVPNDSARGANIFIEGISGDMTIESTTISGGKIAFAAKAYESEKTYYDAPWGKATNWTAYGATGIFVSANRFTTENVLDDEGNPVLDENGDNVTKQVDYGNKRVLISNCTISGNPNTEEYTAYHSYQGGTMYIQANSHVELSNSTVTGSPVEFYGSCIHLANGILNITGDSLIDATGMSTQLGAAIDVNNDSSVFSMTGGRIVGGSVKNIGTAMAIVANASVTVTDVEVDGSVYYNAGTLTVKGDVKINHLGNGQNSGVYMAKGRKIIANELGTNADLVIYAASAANGTVISDNIGDATVENFKLVNGDFYLAKNENALVLTNDAGDNKLAVSGVLYAEWTDDIVDGDFVRLFAEFSGKTISANVTLDLNGNNLTDLSVAKGKTINLFNTSAIEYVAGDGYVTLAENQTNPFVRDFTTKGVIARNLRFVTIQEKDGKYTAHRIYLAVRSTVLYPKTSRNEVAIGYRIALRCDDTLVKYITAYGLIGTGDRSVKVPTTGYYGEGADNDNTKYIGLTYGTNTDAAEKTISGQAFLTITDGISAEDGDDVFSSAVETSLMRMVKSVDEKYDTLSDTQKGQLDDMFAAYQTIMSGWDLKNIKVPETETQD